MNKKYFAIYNEVYDKWCVYVQEQGDSTATLYSKCKNESEAKEFVRDCNSFI